MKSFKSGKPVAIWLLRIVILPVLFHLYYNPVSTLNFTSLTFYTGILMLLCSILLIAGGFLSKPEFTIIAGLIIFCFSAYKAILSFKGIFDIYFTTHLIPTAVGFFFFTNGNDK